MSVDKLLPKQERFMLALATAPSVTAACEQAGIARSTGQKYLKNVTFKKVWREYRSELMQQTTNQLQNSLEAVAVLREIMLDDTVSPYARQQAAQTVLTMAYKSHEVDNVLEVIEEIKEAMAEHEP